MKDALFVSKNKDNSAHFAHSMKNSFSYNNSYRTRSTDKKNPLNLFNAISDQSPVFKANSLSKAFYKTFTNRTRKSEVIKIPSIKHIDGNSCNARSNTIYYDMVPPRTNNELIKKVRSLKHKCTLYTNYIDPNMLPKQSTHIQLIRLIKQRNAA